MDSRLELKLWKCCINYEFSKGMEEQKERDPLRRNISSRTPSSKSSLFERMSLPITKVDRSSEERPDSGSRWDTWSGRRSPCMSTGRRKSHPRMDHSRRGS